MDQIAEIPMSNDIIHTRNGWINSSTQNVTVPFGLQFDLSTDVARRSQLLVFVRYLANDCIKEDFLFYE